jgi:hypothetical protein
MTSRSLCSSNRPSGQPNSGEHMTRFLSFLFAFVMVAGLTACEPERITLTETVTDTVIVHDTTTVTDTLVTYPNFITASSGGSSSWWTLSPVLGSLPNEGADMDHFVMLPQTPSFAGFPLNAGIPAVGYYLNYHRDNSAELSFQFSLQSLDGNSPFGFGRFRMIGDILLVNGEYPNESVTEVPINATSESGNFNLGRYTANDVYFYGVVVRETYCFSLGTDLVFTHGLRTPEENMTGSSINIGCGFQGPTGAGYNLIPGPKPPTVGDFVRAERRRKNIG